MKLEIYLANQIVSFTLPYEVHGSFSFDENKEEQVKLIHVDAGNIV